MSLKATTEEGTTEASAMAEKESQPPAYHVRIDENSEQVCVSEIVSQSAAEEESKNLSQQLELSEYEKKRQIREQLFPSKGLASNMPDEVDSRLMPSNSE